MEDKYRELKEQCEMELKWTIDSINENHEAFDLPYDLTLVKFIGTTDNHLTEYERGMLFAYLSIKSKIDSLEEDGPT